uniref:Uncharacterized protein n=1 Tax=viral metagenome TaxID=1070528 RepID=A0A6C0KY57_9ZZZZ|tara:strand:- start:5083 stop:5778 length:696 start_codon:yes stop_codon:yes gene_type:complete
MKNTIRNSVKEVYNIDLKNIKTTSPDSIKSFKTNRIDRGVENVINNNTSNNSYNVPTQMVGVTQQSIPYYIYITILILLLLIVAAIYYYRSEIKDYFNTLLNPKKRISKEVVKMKDNDEELKEIKIIEEDKEKVIEKDKLTIKKGGEVVVKDKVIKETNKKDTKPKVASSKINDDIRRQYSTNQIVSGDDMYCYVGKDDDIRQCVQVYKDDICTSGDIFNRIDECLVQRQN